MTFAAFVAAVEADLLTLGCAIEPEVRGYIARWSSGVIVAELHRTDADVAFLRLAVPGASVAPVDVPLDLRGVRLAAMSVAAALDSPSASP